MTRVGESVARVIAILLVAVSAIGAIAAGGVYYSLAVLNVTSSAANTLHESYSSHVDRTLAASKADASLRASLGAEAAQVGVAQTSVMQAALRIQEIVLLDIVLWFLMFILASVALFLVERHRKVGGT